MAVEIEHAVSAPAASVIIGIGVSEADGSHPGVGAGWLGIPEVWLGFAADAAYEVEGGEDEDDDEDDSSGEAEGLTLEAENGVIYSGFIVYDAGASSCYAVDAGESYTVSLNVIVDSTSLDWERPLRIRVVYKAESEGEIFVFVFSLQQGSVYLLESVAVSPTTGYVAADLVIPASREPFDGIGIDGSGEIRIDAIQLAPATGDWPLLNPCSN